MCYRIGWHVWYWCGTHHQVCTNQVPTQRRNRLAFALALLLPKLRGCPSFFRQPIYLEEWRKSPKITRLSILLPSDPGPRTSTYAPATYLSREGRKSLSRREKISPPKISGVKWWGRKTTREDTRQTASLLHHAGQFTNGTRVLMKVLTTYPDCDEAVVVNRRRMTVKISSSATTLQ